MAAGKASVERKFVINRKPTTKMHTVATLARKSVRCLMGKLDKTKMSSRSGKNKSHSKTTMIPITTME